MKVLVVDDSDVVRERLCNLLKPLPGIEVLAQARSAEKAEQLLKEISPDIVVLDIHMPDKSGIALLEEIKQHSPSPTVIMLTNYAFTEYRFRCLNAGASYFFEKSTEFEQVVELIEHMCA